VPSAESRAAGLAAEGLDAFGLPMRAITDQGVDLGIGDLIVGALAVGTGEPLRGNPLGSATTALHLAPWANWWPRRQSMGVACSLLTAGRAIIWGARFEQRLDPIGSGSAGPEMLVPPPRPAEPDEHDERQQEPTQANRHTRSRDTIRRHAGALRKDTGNRQRGQSHRKQGAELSTTKRGSTVRCTSVKNNANRAKKWRGFRKTWRSPKPKLASKVLAHGAQNR